MPHKELLSPYGIIWSTEKVGSRGGFSLGSGGGDRHQHNTYDK